MRQTWLLPVATATFVLFVAGSIAAVTMWSDAPWIIPLLAVPSLIVTWFALAVALADLMRRPAHRFPGGRWLWLLLIALLNVVAFLPYWLLVARRPNEED
jgi:hypothetical protein